MSSQKLIIVDYGLGNLYSVMQACKHCSSANISISSNVSEIENADKLILPGVGAFKDGMEGLNQKNLIPSIKKHVADNKPLLGICLGMQMLSTYSYEFCKTPGLDVIRGEVVPIKDINENEFSLKTPHIGWASLYPSQNDAWRGSIFDNLTNDPFVYLLHSYHFIPENKNNVLAYSNYGGKKLTVAVIQGNIIGCQFHPEKSGEVGLQIIRNFLLL